MTANIFKALEYVSGPATLIAYIAALAAWSFVSYSLARLKANSKDLAALPKDRRIEALELIYGPIPRNITAEQWIRDRRMRLLLVGFIATLAAILMTAIWLTK